MDHPKSHLVNQTQISRISEFQAWWWYLFLSRENSLSFAPCLGPYSASFYFVSFVLPNLSLSLSLCFISTGNIQDTVFINWVSVVSHSWSVSDKKFFFSFKLVLILRGNFFVLDKAKQRKTFDSSPHVRMAGDNSCGYRVMLLDWK